MRCENGADHDGGTFDSQINKRKKLMKRVMAASTYHPSKLVSDAMNNESVDDKFVPDEVAVCKERSKMKFEKTLLQNTGDSPEELGRLCQDWARGDDQVPWQPWVHIPKVRTHSGQTFVPYTTDYNVSSAFKCTEEGRSLFKRERFLVALGDYTHHETKDLLKKMMIALGGKHFPEEAGE